MKKKTLIINVAIMTATSLLLRTVGISYRVYVTNKIGAEGMGLYTLIGSAFLFAAIVSTAGISTAVMRLVSEELGRNLQGNVPRILRRAFVYALAVSIPAAAVMFFGASFIGTSLLHDERSILSIQILAPCLPFMSIASCLKGYFLAMRKASMPAVSDIIEQFSEMALFVVLVNFAAPYGLAYTCAAIMVGATLSEVASCAYLYIGYLLDRRRPDRRKKRAAGSGNMLTKRLLSIALPVAGSSGLNAGLRTMENIMIPLGLRKHGESTEKALGMYGMVRGMAIPVLFFPAAFLSAFSSLLIPEISEANVKSGPNALNHVMTRVLQVSFLLSILVSAVFMVFSHELGMLIYASAETGHIMQLLAPLVPLMYLDMMVDGMLKGLNQQVSVLRYNIIDSVIRVALVYFLVPALGFNGFILVMYTSNILNPVLSINRLLHVTGIRLRTADWVLKPALAAAAAALGTRTLLLLSGIEYAMTVSGLTVSILLVCFLYLVMLMLFDCITAGDLGWLHGSFRRAPRKTK